MFRVRFGGYDEWQVDLHLDRVERQLGDLEERTGFALEVDESANFGAAFNTAEPRTVAKPLQNAQERCRTPDCDEDTPVGAPAANRKETAKDAIPADQKVLLLIGSANRDEEVFEDPFRFDVERTPNDHVAFGGGGAHYCLGANLAKLELEIIFDEILERMPTMELAGEAQTLRSNFIGGIKHLPVRFAAGPRKHPVGAGLT